MCSLKEFGESLWWMNKTLFKAQTQSHPYHQSPWPSLSSSPSPSSSLYIAHHIHHHHHQLPHQSSKKTFLTFDNHHQHTHDICQFFYTSAYQTKIYPKNALILACFQASKHQSSLKICTLFFTLNTTSIKSNTNMPLKLHEQIFPYKKFYLGLKLFYTSTACGACDKYHVCISIFLAILKKYCHFWGSNIYACHLRAWFSISPSTFYGDFLYGVVTKMPNYSRWTVDPSNSTTR